jgi:CRP-like cAMP-binding protein
MGFSIEPNVAWNVYDIIIELSFIADIIVSFFTAYEMSDLVLNTDKSHISARYLKSWFVLDVVSGLPVSMLTLNEGFLLLKFFKFARIMRLIRVMRVFKITRLLKIMKMTSLYEEKPFSTSEETYIKFLRLSFVVLIFTHITSCFWSKLANDKNGSDTWEDAVGIEDSSLWTRYLASFYFVYVTMNTTGYGDILAQNDMETFCLLFIIVLGAFLVAHVVAEISETNTGRECNTERVFLLRSYLANKKIPQVVQEAMLKQVTYANTMRTSYSEIDIWRKLPFQMRVELAVVCHKPIISQFPNIFDTSSPPIIYQLLTYFEPTFIIQGAYAFTFETGSGGIYLVGSGVGEVVDENEFGDEIIIGEHREGKVFGMECIQNEQLTFVGVRAKEDMSCYRISAACVTIMYKEHPSLSRDFFKKIQTVCAGTRQDSTKPVIKVQPLSKKQDSFGEKTLTCIGKVANYVQLGAKYLIKEEDVVDTKAVYIRANFDSGEWTPSFKDKLEMFLKKNSPSLVLSNESWKKFVLLKDYHMESRGMTAQIEADTGTQTGAVVVPDFQAVADIITDGDDGKGPVEEDDIFQNSTEEFLDESITALQSPNNPRKVIDSLVSFETSEQID